MTLDLTKTELPIAELYTITTSNGDIARFTSHDVSITYSTNIYQAIPIQRTKVSYYTDLQVDKVEISFGLVGLTIGTRNYSIPEIIKKGFFRNANVKIHKVDYTLLDADSLVFEGWITEGISYNRGICTISVGSILDKLNEKFPKLIYSEYCQLQLYSSYCGLTKNDWRGSGTITNTSDTTFYGNAFLYINSADGWFTKGELRFSTGDNTNISRSIINHGDGYVVVLNPFPEVSVPGNAFYVWPGCDKSGKTCHEKFNNYDNFFGFEYCPKSEVLIG